MDVEMVARNIQIILAPVVLVTACAILSQGLLGRYAAITDRLRALSAERLSLLYSNSVDDNLRRERLALIDNQRPIWESHHKRAHDAVVALYSAVAIFVADMFAIAVAAIYEVGWLATAVLLLFLAGAAVLLLGVLTAAFEIRTSHQVLHHEVMRVRGLAIPDIPEPTPGTARLAVAAGIEHQPQEPVSEVGMPGPGQRPGL